MERASLIGLVVGRLTVIGDPFLDQSGKQKVWKIPCKCSCGNISTPRKHLIVHAKISSCSLCLKGELGSAFKHGLVGTKTYHSWASMLSRCYKTNNNRYIHYGGRGISVCDRWNPKVGGSFENFLEDMGECNDGASLDRKDVNGNYIKENCWWAPLSWQAFNQRKRVTNKSGRTGVIWIERLGKWRAAITLDGTRKSLGCFSSFEDACLAREVAEKGFHGSSKS